MGDFTKTNGLAARIPVTKNSCSPELAAKKTTSIFAVVCAAIIIAEVIILSIEFVTGNSNLCVWPIMCCPETIFRQRTVFIALFGAFVVFTLLVPAILSRWPVPSTMIDNLWQHLTTNIVQYSGLAKVIWRLSHFVFYCLLGLFSPCYFKESFALSVLWESLECSSWGSLLWQALWKCETMGDGCGGLFDVLLNAFGLMVGCLLSVYVYIPTCS